MAGQLKCIKCGKSELDFQQDSRGCEYITNVTIPNAGDIIFLCSECISKFQFVTDLPRIEREAYQFYSEKYTPIIIALFKIQSELKKINDEANIPDFPMNSSEQSEK